LAALTVAPMPAKSEAAAATNSGATFRYDMSQPPIGQAHLGAAAVRPHRSDTRWWRRADC
jgi:hypothetical protein